MKYLAILWLLVLHALALLPGFLAGALIGIVVLGQTPLNLIPALIGAYAMHEYYERHGSPF